MTPTNADLRQFILNFFSDEELETLCFDYFREVRQDFTIGMIKNSKVMLLIDYCESRSRMGDLYAALERERPAAWREKFGAPPVETFRRNVSTPPTPTRDPRQVFISHATADAPFAHRLAGDLRAEGWRVWIAPDSIRPGEKWVEAIERGLETSGVYVVALTPAAVASEWVKTETNAAIGLLHEAEIRFIPLKVEECYLRPLWGQFHYITFQDNYEAGLRELLWWMEGEELPRRSGLPTHSITPTERRVVKEQWRQLQALAHEIAELGKQSGDDETRAVFRRFNREFGLTTYKELPQGLFAEGLAFLTAWRDKVAAAVPPQGQGVVSPYPGYRVLSHNHIVHEKTEIEFVRVGIGSFLYRDDKKPLELPEFWIGRYPVTNAQYKRFLDANPAYPIPFGDKDWVKPYNWDKKTRIYPADKADHPVVLVSWNDAKAFCDWAGLRLPTEQQWEKAARGDRDGRIFPWEGNWVKGWCNTFEARVGGTTPVGQYTPQSNSLYGCADMAGNVWEWTASWYDQKQSRRVLRGGSWLHKREEARVSSRDDDSPDKANFSRGFRVVAPVDSGS